MPLEYFNFEKVQMLRFPHSENPLASLLRNLQNYRFMYNFKVSTRDDFLFSRKEDEPFMKGEI